MWVKVFNRQIDSIEITVVLICRHYTVHWLCKCILFLANFVHHVWLKPVHNAIFGDDTRMYYTNECTYEPIMQNGMHRICNCGNDRVFGSFDHHAATIRIDRLYQFLTKYQQFSSLEIKELSWFYLLSTDWRVDNNNSSCKRMHWYSRVLGVKLNCRWLLSIILWSRFLPMQSWAHLKALDFFSTRRLTGQRYVIIFMKPSLV